MKVDKCPKCQRNVSLMYDKDLKKLVCPKCGFQDRRFGNSVMNPSKEKRGVPKCHWQEVKVKPKNLDFKHLLV